jgi:endonuclease/exonuclease/phosphatase (EEP) superfamily protein YafD
LHRVQSLRHEGDGDGGRGICILSVNVKMSNRRFGAVVDLIRDADPDIAIVIEADDAWARALAPLKSRLPYAVEWPCDNSYGMVLLSRLPLIEPELRFLVFERVPSIRTGVELRSGDVVRLYAVHPEPPVPYEDTVGRDGELVRVAREAQSDPLPAIVAGDLNDVAWSRTTRRFQRLSGLFDPRVGRGFFNTFDARIPFLRWPLDHLFHDPRFRLVRIERLAHVGSDHFPILFELVLHERPPDDRGVEAADQQDFREAREIAAEASRVERSPVGTDWERAGG